MMKRRLNFNGRRSEAAEASTTTSSSAPAAEPVEWEMRPGGMLVQKRGESSGDFATANLRIRVVYGAVLYQISTNSQSSFGKFILEHFFKIYFFGIMKTMLINSFFGLVAVNFDLEGELKKLLTAETGLQPAEQRLIFRGKERENGEYLDTCGVKDRSKVILIDDPESKERRMVEMRRKAKIETIQRLIDDVSTEVDKLAEQVVNAHAVNYIFVLN